MPRKIISDNIILSHELIKEYGRKGLSPRCMMKIDMRKAYDSVEWCFLKKILVSLQFSAIFVKWITNCVKTVSYSILINGKPSAPFSTKKGLRQRNPMSPFLFVLVMEYFARLLKTLQDNPDFNYHPKCARMRVV